MKVLLKFFKVDDFSIEMYCKRVTSYNTFLCGKPKLSRSLKSVQPSISLIFGICLFGDYSYRYIYEKFTCLAISLHVHVTTLYLYEYPPLSCM